MYVYVFLKLISNSHAAKHDHIVDLPVYKVIKRKGRYGMKNFFELISPKTFLTKFILHSCLTHSDDEISNDDINDNGVAKPSMVMMWMMILIVMTLHQG